MVIYYNYIFVYIILIIISYNNTVHNETCHLKNTAEWYIEKFVYCLYCYVIGINV